MIKSGLVSITFRQLSPAEIVGMVSDAGLDSIEWGGDIHVPHGDVARAKEVLSMTCDAGLAVGAYGSYYRIGHSEGDGLPFESVLESAVALKAPTIRVWAGMQHSKDSDEGYYSKVASESRRIAEMAQPEGITVSYEYHGGTLTDTNDSAQRLLKMVDHPSIRTFWQPPNNRSEEYCLDGLLAVAAHLTNLHVFTWTFSEGNQTRRPLEEGVDRWKDYLAVAACAPGDRYASIEFVVDDKPENFPADAAALKGWLAGLHSGQ